MPLDATHNESVVRRLADQAGMPFVAKSAAPNAPHGTLRHAALDQAATTALDQAATTALTLFNAPAGYLLTDSLAATLAEQGRPTLWLRLGQEDRDPATFLISLIAAAQRLSPEIGAATLEQMRRHPGPASGYSRSWRAQWRIRIYTRPELLVTSPCQVWSWDITNLRGPVPGVWYSGSVILDIFSRKIVGCPITEREDAALAEVLIAESCTREGVVQHRTSTQRNRLIDAAGRP